MHQFQAPIEAEAATPLDVERQRRVLLISNRVMHYRVSVYNYFARRFLEQGWRFEVLTNAVEGHGRAKVQFQCTEEPFSTRAYIRHIESVRPDAVVIFLHLKDLVVWPLMHWLKLRRTPFAFWTKGRNLDDPDNVLRSAAFEYVHQLSDALILYTSGCRKYVSPRHRWKTFVANNTINFADIPAVPESKDEIKASLGIPFEKVVLFVGRIGDERNRKKVDHLIDMFRELDRQDIGLVIVGSGLAEDLRARLNPRNSLYLGAVHDDGDRQINRIFKMADVCSIPGHVGLGLNQAFFWGLPVVTEKGNQPPEIEYLRNGRNGFLVSENDVHALRDRLLTLLDDDRMRGELSQRAREDILNHASIEAMQSAFRRCVDFMC